MTKLPEQKPETPEERKQRIAPLLAMRMKKRDEWDAFWKIQEYDSRARPYMRFRYWIWRYVIDKPVTLWRENVIEPIQDKFGHWPYYHRRFNRVPTVDECHVNDEVCYFEAQMQYRLDKLVDNRILELLKHRVEDCLVFYDKDMLKCSELIEDYEEADLNWYIKYGELGWSGDVLGCYMKQKHRLIWERRNPHIMAERQRLYDEHKREVAMGLSDTWFWKRGAWYNFKDYKATEFRNVTIVPYSSAVKDEGLVSLDPEYYKKRKEDGGKTKIATPWDVFP